jgi:uncharacterized protein YuzB (UPF0349 family)
MKSFVSVAASLNSLKLDDEVDTRRWVERHCKAVSGDCVNSWWVSVGPVKIFGRTKEQLIGRVQAFRFGLSISGV